MFIVQTDVSTLENINLIPAWNIEYKFVFVFQILFIIRGKSILLFQCSYIHFEENKVCFFRSKTLSMTNSII